MDPVAAILAFTLAATLMTLTPGLDTALVLRTATVEGARPALAAGVGIVTGCLAWGLAAALGIGAVLALSEIGFRVLQLAGAAYLLWLGGRMLWGAWRPSADTGIPAPQPPGRGRPGRAGRGWFWRGLMTNLLNPKVGAFYLGFLPQFIPPGVPVVPFGLGLAAIHAALGLAWFAALVLATRPVARALARPAVTRGIDGVTGGVLILLGLRLALERRG
jgi:threonine/homoserine/homoserine lactone efflux protein